MESPQHPVVMNTDCLPVRMVPPSPEPVWSIHGSVRAGSGQPAYTAQSGGGCLGSTCRTLSINGDQFAAAIGRVEDVDIAAESANLAKYSILTQASAAMVAQANSTNDVALMLLRYRNSYAKRISQAVNDSRSRQDVAPA